MPEVISSCRHPIREVQVERALNEDGTWRKQQVLIIRGEVVGMWVSEPCDVDEAVSWTDLKWS